ncbi:NGG1p interacting factor NIF3 [Pseudomonadota bacterium]|nr:NGG1p interacting factor NIF3 [Pseudomonadota bacterium]
MYKLVFFVPESHKEAVKNALFEQGAGRYDGYDYCSWETLGTGQFKPLSGSQPFIGQQNNIEKVIEFRVEMICSKPNIKAVLEALIEHHPYDVPAYDVQLIQTLNDL